MRRTLLLILPLAAAAIAGYFVLRPLPAAEPVPKVDGDVYMLGKDFDVNLGRGRLAKISIGLVLAHHQPAPWAGEGEAGGKPPEGYGALAQEAVVRALVIDTLSGTGADELISHAGRMRVKSRMLKAIVEKSDVPARAVLIPDVTVQ